MTEKLLSIAPLDVNSLPLSGVHLIEASAGTGKTFNITRIYLRLLLESELSVTQILVMTFTNAATQELRGRLTETLHQALQYWQSADIRQTNSDPVFAQLFERLCSQRSVELLSLALIEMDEAAIYTLHGFCQRVLKQMAFSTGNALQVNLQNDQQKILQRSAQDWFRLLREEPDKLALLSQSNWHTPEAFIQHFKVMLDAENLPNVVDLATIERDHITQLNALKMQYKSDFEQHLSDLCAHQDDIHEALIDNHKKVDVQEARRVEWQQLLEWLRYPVIEDIPAGVGSFLHGNRYRKNEAMKTLFTPVVDLRKEIVEKAKKLSDKTEKRQQQLPVFDIVLEGIAFIKQKLASEKRLRSEVNFDDLIKLLAQAVATDDDISAQLVRAFPAALVDEFQDTDAQQYAILSKVYVQQTALLVMIGDPKQAIYGFRGGDIFTYLRARQAADHVWYMDTNWRSTKSMVDAYNRVFWGTELDKQRHPVFGYGIDYEPVKATKGSAAAKRPMSDPSNPNSRAALTYVVANTDVIEDAQSSQQKILQQTQLSLWCVTEVKRLLAAVKLGDDNVMPSDIAILVRNRMEAERIGDALRQAGLSAVYLSDKTALFSSIQAHELMLLLTGIWHCDNDNALIRALSSALLGLDPMHLARMQQDPLAKEWSELRARVYSYRQTWLTQGVMPLILMLLKNHYQPEANGERALTNYLHLTELIEQASRQHSHPIQILQWLRAKIANLEADEQYEQRLESDAGLIKIVTLHKSKGLEYPFVFVPYANEYNDPTLKNRSPLKVLRFFDPDKAEQVWQLGQSQRSLDLLREQEHAESIRLLYVAITRAEYRCYLGMGSYEGSEQSAIGLALDKNNPDNLTVDWYEFLHRLSQDKRNQCTVAQATSLPEVVNLQTVTTDAVKLAAKSSARLFKQYWHVHSFSGLTRFNHNETITEREAESSATIEAWELETETIAVVHEQIQITDARFSFPKGATPGNFIHDVFEHTDFSAPQWAQNCESVNKKYALLPSDQLAPVVEWFDSVVDAPIELKEYAQSSFTLRKLPLSATLREAEFYFPISDTNSQQLGQLLTQHRLQLHKRELLTKEQAVQAVQLGRSQLAGMMHGFIDLIFTHNNKFYVADYKSTYLGDSLSDYSPAALAVNNLVHAYDLQYLIYAVALHRYLKQQIVDYDPQVHFGGVYYLYVRGMHANTPSGLQNGVFSTTIDIDLLLDLDRVFEGRR